MKKIVLLPACLFAICLISEAQTKPPPPPRPPIIVRAKYVPPTSELKEFYQKNPAVGSLYWKSEKDIVVVHKDKTEFVYNMKNEEDKAAFKAKYGSGYIKTPPPPPPPPPHPKTNKPPIIIKSSQ